MKSPSDLVDILFADQLLAAANGQLAAAAKTQCVAEETQQAAQHLLPYEQAISTAIQPPKFVCLNTSRRGTEVSGAL